MLKTFDLFVSVNGRRLKLTDAPVSDFPHTARVYPDQMDTTGVTVETPVFSADALSAAAYAAAERNGLPERSIVMAQSSCFASAVPAVVEPKERKVTLVLPIPQTQLLEDASLKAVFPGVTCIVSQTKLPDSDLTGPALLVLRDPECKMLQIRYLGSDRQETDLVSSGLAAVAAAIDLAQGLTDGVIEYGIGMPGGTAEVGVSKREGTVTGVSICSLLALD